MAKAKDSIERGEGGQPIEVMASKEEKTIYQWEALERPYQRRDREFWTTALSVLGLVSLILFFVKEFFLIAALAALVFLYYVLTTVPPSKASYKLTNKGLYLGTAQRVNWEVLKRFWIDQKWGYPVLNVETWLRFPRVVSLVIPKDEERIIVKTMEKYIPQEKDSPNFTDKFSSWVANKFPLEKKKK